MKAITMYGIIWILIPINKQQRKKRYKTTGN